MRPSSETRYELYYWPQIPGRGEYVRLVFEAAGEPYVDVARLPEEDGGGVGAIVSMLKGRHEGPLPFAPPFLRVNDLVVAQTPLVCQLVAQRVGLVPKDEALQLEALQHALTIADLVTEAHDAHHPIGSGLYYEDQKDEARRRAEQFRDARLPKFLGYFERVIERNGAGKGLRPIGSDLSYVDLSLFHTIEGLRYAFPNAMRRHEGDVPRLLALHAAVAEHPSVAAYLRSERRLAFNEHGIFRHYPALDPA